MLYSNANKKERTDALMVPAKLKAKPTFDPVVNSKMLEAFQEIVTQEAHEKWDKCQQKGRYKPNISKKEKDAIKKTPHS